MSEQADESAIAQRAELLPEEQAAGSDDAEAQAEAILEESDERTERPEKTRGSPRRPRTEAPPTRVVKGPLRGAQVFSA